MLPMGTKPIATPGFQETVGKNVSNNKEGLQTQVHPTYVYSYGRGDPLAPEFPEMIRYETSNVQLQAVLGQYKAGAATPSANTVSTQHVNSSLGVFVNSTGEKFGC